MKLKIFNQKKVLSFYDPNSINQYLKIPYLLFLIDKNNNKKSIKNQNIILFQIDKLSQNDFVNFKFFD